MGFYKCANSTENVLFKGTYQEALSNCSALEDFNNLDEESVEFMRRYYGQKVSEFEPNGHWSGPVRFWTEIKRMVLRLEKFEFVLHPSYIIPKTFQDTIKPTSITDREYLIMRLWGGNMACLLAKLLFLIPKENLEIIMIPRTVFVEK